MTALPRWLRDWLCGPLARLSAALSMAGMVAACTLFGVPQTASTAQQTAVDQAYAKAALNILSSAWDAAANTCVDVAQSKVAGGPALLAKCQSILNPARDSLKAADNALRSWQGGSVGSWACTIGSAFDALKNTELAFKDAGVKVPPVLDAALLFVGGFIAEPSLACPGGADAGGQ